MISEDAPDEEKQFLIKRAFAYLVCFQKVSISLVVQADEIVSAVHAVGGVGTVLVMLYSS